MGSPQIRSRPGRSRSSTPRSRDPETCPSRFRSRMSGTSFATGSGRRSQRRSARRTSQDRIRSSCVRHPRRRRRLCRRKASLPSACQPIRSPASSQRRSVRSLRRVRTDTVSRRRAPAKTRGSNSETGSISTSMGARLYSAENRRSWTSPAPGPRSFAKVRFVRGRRRMDADVRESLLRAGRISREARERAVPLIKEGALLLDVAEEVEDLMRKRGAKPAFPTCISIDHVAAHYSPTHDDTLRFRHGNVVKLDLGAQLDGWIADTAVTVEVGTRNWTELVRASELALQTAIEAVHSGVSTRAIGEGIQRAIEAHGYRPVRNLTGHTIERYLLHAGKSVPNIAHGHDFLEAGEGVPIRPVASSRGAEVTTA